MSLKKEACISKHSLRAGLVSLCVFMVACVFVFRLQQNRAAAVFVPVPIHDALAEKLFVKQVGVSIPNGASLVRFEEYDGNSVGCSWVFYSREDLHWLVGSRSTSVDGTALECLYVQVGGRVEGVHGITYQMFDRHGFQLTTHRYATDKGIYWVVERLPSGTGSSSL